MREKKKKKRTVTSDKSRVIIDNKNELFTSFSSLETDNVSDILPVIDPIGKCRINSICRLQFLQHPIVPPSSLIPY